MRTITLLPDRRSQLAIRAAARGERLSSPTTEFSPIEANQAQTLSARWSDLNAPEYDYMMAFWRTAAKGGAKQFLIELPVRGGEPVQCRAKFVGSLSAGGFTGRTATIEIGLEVIPMASRYPLSSATATKLAGIATEQV